MQEDLLSPYALFRSFLGSQICLHIVLANTSPLHLAGLFSRKNLSLSGILYGGNHSLCLASWPQPAPIHDVFVTVN